MPGYRCWISIRLCIQWSSGRAPLEDNVSCCCKILGFAISGSLVTARKRSLGQGNIFRSVCQEFCPQGEVCLSACWDTTPWTRHSPWTRHPPWDQAPPPPRIRHPPEQSMLGDTVNEWAVRTLLECILVLNVEKPRAYEMTPLKVKQISKVRQKKNLIKCF